MINLYVAFLGTIFGSFLGVIIDRLPEKRNIATGRSQCDHCHHTLTPLELIPILSFLIQKGRCRNCQSPVSFRYVIIELITGVAFFLAYCVFSYSIQFVIACILALLLIVIAGIDIKTMLIYDRFHILMLLLALCNWYFLRPAINDLLLGAIIVSVPLFVLVLLTDAMGMGDVKLMASTGFLLGTGNILAAFFLSSIIGGCYSLYLMLIRKQSGKTPIPFGPALCCGIFFAYLVGPQLVTWYLSLLIH